MSLFSAILPQPAMFLNIAKVLKKGKTKFFILSVIIPVYIIVMYNYIFISSKVRGSKGVHSFQIIS